MANQVGALIKEARTGAKLTQEQLAAQVDGLSASDISKAERGEKELSQSQLRQIAKATGVTQASLVNAAKAGTGKKTEKKTEKKAEKKTGSTAKKKEEEFKLTAAEKKLVEAYRAADKDTRDAALKLLKGEKADNDLLGSILGLLSGKK